MPIVAKCVARAGLWLPRAMEHRTSCGLCPWGCLVALGGARCFVAAEVWVLQAWLAMCGAGLLAGVRGIGLGLAEAWHWCRSPERVWQTHPRSSRVRSTARHRGPCCSQAGLSGSCCNKGWSKVMGLLHRKQIHSASHVSLAWLRFGAHSICRSGNSLQASSRSG